MEAVIGCKVGSALKSVVNDSSGIKYRQKIDSGETGFKKEKKEDLGYSM